MKPDPNCHPYDAIAGSCVTWVAQHDGDAAFDGIGQIVYGSSSQAIRFARIALYRGYVATHNWSILCGREQRHTVSIKGCCAINLWSVMTSRDQPIIYRRHPSRETRQQLVDEASGERHGFDAADYPGLEIGMLRFGALPGSIDKASGLA